MKIFYRPEQTAKNVDTFSPSARKPALVVASWRRLDRAAEVIGFEPLTRYDLALAHEHAYVDDVLDLKVPNGFDTYDALLAATLPFTTGSFSAAARHAFTTKESCASPTSGFHHAGYEHGGGFCTFNGLVIAAQKLRRFDGAKRIGILDLDCHVGNGTEDIISRLGLDYIHHYTFGGQRTYPSKAEKWLNKLPGILGRFVGCEVILYQAGADMHVDDPLGGVLTTEQLYVRDFLVFSAFRKLNIPVAWNLAGGYQKPLRKVLDIHDNTARAFWAAQLCIDMSSAAGNDVSQVVEADVSSRYRRDVSEPGAADVSLVDREGASPKRVQ